MNKTYYVQLPVNVSREDAEKSIKELMYSYKVDYWVDMFDEPLQKRKDRERKLKRILMNLTEEKGTKKKLDRIWKIIKKI